MSPIHSDSQAGLSRQGGPCLGLAPGVPQVNTCSRACHHPQPASFSPPQFEPTPTVHLFRPQFRGSTLIPLLLPQPPSSSSANPVSSTLKVYPELASSSSPVLTLLDYYHGPLCPPQSTLDAAAEDPASFCHCPPQHILGMGKEEVETVQKVRPPMVHLVCCLSEATHGPWASGRAALLQHQAETETDKERQEGRGLSTSRRGRLWIQEGGRCQCAWSWPQGRASFREMSECPVAQVYRYLTIWAVTGGP